MSLLLISGSLRDGSTNTAVLRTAQAIDPDTELFAAMGALPGSFKNLLEWLVGGGEAYRKPIAWINVSGPAAPTGAADGHASLRKVVSYLSMEIVDEACVRIPVARNEIGEDGLVADPGIREQLAAALAALREGAARVETF